MGDACHATVPFYGQGMNAGFEDCFLLNQIIEKSNTLDDFKDQVIDFLELRKIDTDAMQDLSMHNFIVMRDKTSVWSKVDHQCCITSCSKTII